ncbi:hypothetical protein R6Z07F_012226 [Ovis aries]
MRLQLRATILESTAVPDMQWIQSDELLKQAMKNINQVIKNSFKSFPSLVFPAFTTTLTSPVYKQLFPVPRAREAVQEKWMEAINRTILEHEFYKPSNHVKFSFSDTGQQNGGLPRLRLELDRVCMLVRKVRSACGENNSPELKVDQWTELFEVQLHPQHSVFPAFLSRDGPLWALTLSGARHTSCVSVLHALPGLPTTCQFHIQVAMSPKCRRHREFSISEERTLLLCLDAGLQDLLARGTEAVLFISEGPTDLSQPGAGPLKK